MEPSDPSSEIKANEALPSQDAVDERIPCAGQRWMGNYIIEAKIKWGYEREAWRADHPAGCEKVLIIRSGTMDPLRDEAWERLHTIDAECFMNPRDSRLVLEDRYEVYHIPEGETLREWSKKHRASAQALTIWARCFSDALGRLHGKHLAHCHLNPDTIYVVKSDTAVPNLVIGGLERCVCVNRRELVPISMDPFYAPPESAGLFRHSPGDGLKAWDWWSVGRILQELALGRHILEHLLDHELDREHPEMRENAEKLLLEKAHGGTKAGGVEAMPAMDKRIDLLLHGLLTGSRDGRWTSEDVRQWLKGETPTERYKLSKTERLFRWRGRCYTISEIADTLRQKANWNEAIPLLTNKEDPESLIAFIREQPNLRAINQKIEDCLSIRNAPDLRNSPPDIVTEIAVANALHRLAGGPLIWRGGRIDSAYVREFLSGERGDGSILGSIQAFCSGTVLAPLEKLDFEAFRIFSEGSKLAQKSVERAIRLKLLQRGNVPEVTRIWILAFDSPASWLESIKQLKQVYALSEREDIQELFNKERATPDETLLLAWLIPNAKDLGFITHEEWSMRELGKLKARGQALFNALFWLRLSHTLELGNWWFGRFPLVLGSWTILTGMLAFAWPGPFYVPLLLIPGIVALLMRASLKGVVQPILAKFAPSRASWGTWDGSARARIECRRLEETRQSVGELQLQMREINEALEKLERVEPPPQPFPKPPALLTLRLLALLSWMTLLLPGYLSIEKIHQTTNPWTTFVKAWLPEEEQLEYYEPEPKVKLEFPFRIPSKVRRVQVKAQEDASAIQTKLGNKRGYVLTHGYERDTIPIPILTPVPTPDGGLGFMIYDAKRCELTNKKVFILEAPPKRHSFVSIEGKITFVVDY